MIRQDAEIRRAIGRDVPLVLLGWDDEDVKNDAPTLEAETAQGGGQPD